ncbi:MAG: P1 family peptidase, partial [Candidatus Poribacteria bacterium]|nr:P1 family peptidase [Candidatus Poribacteria bacterium]
GVKVGHVTLISGEGKLDPGKGPIRTGVTAILPHDGNLFRDKVTATAHIINAFGKSIGLAQLLELGNIETPILLTNTLNVWTVADAVVDYVSAQNPNVHSFNPIVGECNDSFLNDILGRHVRREHVFQALEIADRTNVEEGVVGAGVGMSGFGWKGGLGTASRVVEIDGTAYTVGALVLTNTGAASDLRIDGFPIGKHLTPADFQEPPGSIMIIVATDAPLSHRQLTRVAKRAAFGLARTGAIASHSSGDFVIAFSTTNRIDASAHGGEVQRSTFPDEAALTHLFRAVIEATEESIINSLLKSHTVQGRDGNIRHGIPIRRVIEILNLDLPAGHPFDG